MNHEQNTDANEPQPSDKWGMIVVLAFVIGLPLLGIITKLLGY
jgi:uncharacterized Tic20 family protein